MRARYQGVPAQYSEHWVAHLDGRTTLSRAIRARLHALQTDLGGEDSLSYQQRSLCRRAVWLEAMIEQQEFVLSKGDTVDQGRLTQAVNSLIGLYRVLGLERKPRPAPTLGELIQRKAAKQ